LKGDSTTSFLGKFSGITISPAGRFYTSQWVKVPIGVSGSSIIIAMLFPYFTQDILISGDISTPSHVYLSGNVLKFSSTVIFSLILLTPHLSLQHTRIPQIRRLSNTHGFDRFSTLSHKWKNLIIHTSIKY